MKREDISEVDSRTIAIHFQKMNLSQETRQLLKQKAEARNIHINRLFAEAFLAKWREVKEFNESVLKEYLLNLP
jgi:hypothetical protein